MVWCDIEDLGESLSVNFGPLNLFCSIGRFTIPYRKIEAYYEPRCLGTRRCGYGVGKVNMCIRGGLRQHALPSFCCHQKQMIIKYKSDQILCRKRYNKVLIAVSGNDYQAFVKMLDAKFGQISNAVII